MTFPSSPYVYVLLDGAGLPFYVGKGRGNRVMHHLKQAAKGAKGPRFDRIREILASGGQYRYEIVSRHETDDQAAQAERDLIASLSGLANLTKGGEIGAVLDPRAKLSRQAALILARLVASGSGDSPIADLLRKEVESPSYNMATWCPEKGVTFGWHCDKWPALPPHLTYRYAAQ